MTDARRAAELAARESYGRLVAILASRSGDIAGAEDALGEAFASALVAWPERGVPENPTGWLLTAARRNVGHVVRHRAVRDDKQADLVLLAEEHGDAASTSLDKRLELMFACAHPAIDERVRTPLVLQTILGLDAEQIASAFLVSPTTMGQRLVRSKAKIKNAGIPFEVPAKHELAERLEDVLDAIYVAFGTAWDDFDAGRGLADEAIFLGRCLVTLLPDEPEAKGLLALMLYIDARRDARRDAAGRFVPLHAQDPARWNRSQIVLAETLLRSAADRAAGHGRARFQCEAAIQSVHVQRAVTGVVQHHALRVLYDLLHAMAPSIGVAVGRAAAALEAHDLASAARFLDELPESSIRDYQPYWVARARLAELGDDRASMNEYLRRALGLTHDPAVRRFLEAQLG